MDAGVFCVEVGQEGVDGLGSMVPDDEDVVLVTLLERRPMESSVEGEGLPLSEVESGEGATEDLFHGHTFNLKPCLVRELEVVVLQ